MLVNMQKNSGVSYNLNFFVYVHDIFVFLGRFLFFLPLLALNFVIMACQLGWYLVFGSVINFLSK